MHISRMTRFLWIFTGADRAAAAARLTLIRALQAGKQVLLLDEPTAALDEENKRQVFFLLAQLSREYSDAVIGFSKGETGALPERPSSLARCSIPIFRPRWQ